MIRTLRFLLLSAVGLSGERRVQLSRRIADESPGGEWRSDSLGASTRRSLALRRGIDDAICRVAYHKRVSGVEKREEERSFCAGI